MSLLKISSKGIYCPQADLYIDPWKPVKKALITHGHSDHSRYGNQYYLCTHSAKPVIRHRLGSSINIESVAYGETVVMNGVKISFHPAGHIIGSAQIRLAYKGEVWVASGDYKLEDDGISEAFESVPCHHFITESTFGLPIYQWEPQQEIFEDINQWWAQNKANGKVTFLTAYALGKAQRILKHLDPSIGEIFTHGAIENTNEVIRAQGFALPKTTRIVQGMPKKKFVGNMVITIPSGLNAPWAKQFDAMSVGVASGWMASRGARRRRAVDRGFVLSDHADWQGLNEAVKASGARHIYVTHGSSKIYSQWLREQGLDAQSIDTPFEGEIAEMGAVKNEASTDESTD